MLFFSEHPSLFPIEKRSVLAGLLESFAESYHTAKLAEAANGECFTEDDLSAVYWQIKDGQAFPDTIPFLNVKAAAFAAAKVEGMFTEAQVLKAIVIARNDGYWDSEEEINNQLKESK